MVGVVVGAGDWEFGIRVARGSGDLGIIRGMLNGGLQLSNLCFTLQQCCNRW